MRPAVGITRSIRQHVNPLATFFHQPPELPEWNIVWPEPENPLHLDVGCGKGRFLIQLASRHPDWNFLGLDVRPLVLEIAERHRKRAGEVGERVHFLQANPQLTGRHIFDSLPRGSLSCVTICHPDPWFKKAHHKRRILNQPFLDMLGDFSLPGTPVLLQTDIEELHEHMREVVRSNERFSMHRDVTLPASHETAPLSVTSDRASSLVAQGTPIHYLVAVRSDSHVSGDLLTARSSDSGRYWQEAARRVLHEIDRNIPVG